MKNFIKMSVAFLVYSHSENADLWPCIFNDINKVSYKYPKYFAVEKEAAVEKTFAFDGFLFYDDTDTYDKKLLSLFAQIQADYIVLIHDNDLLIEFDNTLFETLVSKMVEHKIDRTIFGVAARSGPATIYLTPEDAICRVNDIESPHFMTPYDVGPSVWNKASFIAALLTIPNTQYRDIEQSSIQKYCKEHLNMYGFVSHKYVKSYYVVGRPFYHKFQYLHIFTRRQLMYPKMYMDQEENLWKILEAYPEIKKRSVLDHLINIYNRTV